MRASFFDGLTDAIPKVESFASFDELVAFIEEPFEVGSKEEVGLIGHGVYPDHAKRGKKFVHSMEWFALDFDEMSAEAFQTQVLSRILSYPLRCFIHTTFSHGEKEGYRARAMFPLSRPVTPAEWEAIFPHLFDLFGKPDKQCRDVSRIFFLPSYHPDRASLYESANLPGLPFPVDEVLSRTRLVSQQTEERNPIDLTVFRQWVSGIRRNSDVNARKKDLLTKVIAGESLAIPGERDSTVWYVLRLISDRFPLCTPESLAALVHDSALATYKEDPAGFEALNLADKAERALQEIENEKTAKALEEKANAERRLRLVGRLEPYSSDELSGFGPMDFSWILLHRKAYYFFVNGAYQGPYTKEEAESISHILLSPATTAGVDPWKVSPTGQLKPKTILELTQEYGRVVSRVVNSLSAHRNELEGETLVIAATPPRALKPRYSDRVERWLSLLCRGETQKVLDWLATLTDLTKPSAALFFKGAKGAGKSLFASGCAAVFRSEATPTPYESAIGDFNSALLNNPVVFADEVETGFNTGTFREFIVSFNRSLRAKYLPETTLRGAVRVILAANNPGILRSKENLTPDDIAAISERILMVEVDKESSAFLKDVQILPEEIAQHIRHLQQTRSVKYGPRLIVSGSGEKLANRLATSGGLRAALNEWLIRAIVDPRPQMETAVYWNDGKLYANPHLIAQHWATYHISGSREPTSENLRDAALSIAVNEKLKRVTLFGVGKGVAPVARMLELNPEMLCSFGERSGLVDRPTLLGRLRQVRNSAKLN